MVFHDAATEQDDAISSEHFDLTQQIPSARPVRDPVKEQADTELAFGKPESRLSSAI